MRMPDNLISYLLTDEMGVQKGNFTRSIIMEISRTIAHVDEDKVLEFTDINSAAGNKLPSGAITVPAGASVTIGIHPDCYGLVPRAGQKDSVLGISIAQDPGESGVGENSSILVGEHKGVQPRDVPIPFKLVGSVEKVVELPQLLVANEAMIWTLTNTSAVDSVCVFTGYGQVYGSETAALGRATMKRKGLKVGRARSAFLGTIAEAGAAGSRELLDNMPMISQGLAGGRAQQVIDTVKNIVTDKVTDVVANPDGLLDNGKKLLGNLRSKLGRGR